MKKRLIATLLVAGTIPAATAPAAEHGRKAVFVSISAQDRHGIFVRDLKPEEVTLLLDGEPVDLRYFTYQDVRTAIAFVIENSPRTARFRKSMPQWGRINTLDRIRYRLMDDFVEPLAETASMMVAEFFRDLVIRQGFTDDVYALRSALNGIEPNVAHVLQEQVPVGRMLARSVTLLQQRPERRKVLVLFTATVDADSVADLEEYREMLRLAEVEVYVVSFAPRQTSGGGYSHAEKINRFYFNKLTEETSGRLYLSGEFVFLDELMNDLRSRLTHSYTLGFYVRPGEHPEEHRLEVKLSRPKCDVRHRKVVFF